MQNKKFGPYKTCNVVTLEKYTLNHYKLSQQNKIHDLVMTAYLQVEQFKHKTEKRKL